MNTSRLSPVVRAALSPDEQALYDEVTSGRHNPTGPTAIWSRSPRLAKAALDFGDYVRFGSVLEPRLRELAILVTAVEMRCENEWVPHERLAREAGLDDGVIASIRDGFRSDDPAERAVHDFVRSLHRDHDVADDAYAAVTALIGDRGVVDLISTVGFYTTIAMLLNATRAPITRPHNQQTEPRS